MSRESIIKDNSKVIKLKECILDFDEKYNTRPKASYKDIYEYVKVQFEQQKLDFKYPSYTWWKTTGKCLIDEYNQVKIQTIRISESEQIDVVLILDLVRKYGGENKKILMENLAPIDTHIKYLVSIINEKEERLGKLQNELSNAMESNKKIKQKNNNLQSLLLSLFCYGSESKEAFTDMMSTGKHKNKLVNLSLAQTFGSPDLFIKEVLRSIKDSETEIAKSRNASNLKEKKVLNFADDKPDSKGDTNLKKDVYEW